MPGPGACPGRYCGVGDGGRRAGGLRLNWDSHRLDSQRSLLHEHCVVRSVSSCCNAARAVSYAAEYLVVRSTHSVGGCMIKTPSIVWSAICLTACASQPRVADGAASATAGFPACTAPPSPTDTRWREVRAAGFTFCVPASWRSHGPAAGPALDPRTWRTPTIPDEPSSASIMWGTGETPTHLDTRTETVVSRGGGE